MKTRHKVGLALLIILLGVYGLNASWIAGTPQGDMTLVSHRGVHQTFSRSDLTNDTCTAARIFEPEHTYIENTLESFAAAIDFGADMIELDIHPTTDGEFVVFHDWILECRTNGTGRTRDHDLATLQSLDIGYGYTADGGTTFPFRGKYKGAMPTLKTVLAEYPDIHFIINIKSRSETEAEALLTYVETSQWDRLSVSGHGKPLAIIKTALPQVMTVSKATTKACLKGYILTGWMGRVPETCNNTYVAVPSNYRHIMWGWPHRFEKRLNSVGSQSLLMGPYVGTGSTGIDDMKATSVVPVNYKGLVWINKIETVGPVLKSPPI